MEELSIYFAPLEKVPEASPDRLSGRIRTHRPDKGLPEPDKESRIALFTIGEKGEVSGLDPFREAFYQLADHFPELGIIDLGKLKPGHEEKDTHYALSRTVAQCLKEELIPVLIGGGHELAFPHFKGYQDLERTINLAVVDPRIDLGDPEKPMDERSFLGHLLAHQPNFLFNYVQIGVQRHFVPPELIEVMERMNFDLYGLGEVQEEIAEMEPVLRDVDMLSFDLSAMKGSEILAGKVGGPNGLYGEEACQLMRYAGMNDKLSSLGIHGDTSGLIPDEESGEMLAQMLWYFLEGYSSRKEDLPILHKKDFRKYTVELQDAGHQLVFYKSRKSGRWWMEVPYPPDPVFDHQQKHLTPCSYKDYLKAMEDEIPDKWLRTYRKLA